MVRCAHAHLEALKVICHFYLFFINFSQKDRGHTKGKPVLGAPPYTHTITKTKCKKQAKIISNYIHRMIKKLKI